MSLPPLHQNLTADLRLAPLLAPALAQSLIVLQMPLLELSEWVQKKLEENPLVEILYENTPHTPSHTPSRVMERRRVVEPRDLSKEESLNEYLESQARLTFERPEELTEALALIAELDERGLLPCHTADTPVLKALQLFDPPGICARSLRESLLLQLESREERCSTAFAVIHSHFDDLLHHRFAKIGRELGCSLEGLYEALYVDIARLSFNPASRFSSVETPPSIPDLFIREEEGVWRVQINPIRLPPFRFQKCYIDQMKKESCSKEALTYLKGCRKEVDFLLQALRKRTTTLLRLGRLLLRTEIPFLEGRQSSPSYLTLSKAAQALRLHPSTIARTIAHKQVSCAHFGILPLKFFFHQSASELGEAIAAIVAKERGCLTLSDQQIAEQLNQLGITCARRTVAKYRKLFQIPSVSLRRNKQKQ